MISYLVVRVLRAPANTINTQMEILYFKLAVISTLLSKTDCFVKHLTLNIDHLPPSHTSVQALFQPRKSEKVSCESIDIKRNTN